MLLDSLDLVEDHVVNDIVVGSHLLAVSSQHVGLASTIDPQGGHLQKLPPADSWSVHIGKGAKELASMLSSTDTFQSSLALAAINSLIFNDNYDLFKAKAQDIILKEGRGKNVAVIGHFPFVTRLAHEFRNLWVIELQPRKGDLSVEEGFKVLPSCSVVAITATTIINKTLEGILNRCHAGSYKMILGPSTPLSQTLFQFGIDLLGGTRVKNKKQILKGIQENLPFRYLDGVETVCLKAL